VANAEKKISRDADRFGHQPFAPSILREITRDARAQCESTVKTMRFLLFIILILLLIAALPTWPYSTGWGYYPSGGLGLVLLIVLLVVLLR
jgi:hypothetical protein